jgi:hypothetical protein
MFKLRPNLEGLIYKITETKLQHAGFSNFPSALLPPQQAERPQHALQSGDSESALQNWWPFAPRTILLHAARSGKEKVGRNSHARTRKSKPTKILPYEGWRKNRLRHIESITEKNWPMCACLLGTSGHDKNPPNKKEAVTRLEAKSRGTLQKLRPSSTITYSGIACRLCPIKGKLRPGGSRAAQRRSPKYPRGLVVKKYRGMRRARHFRGRSCYTFASSLAAAGTVPLGGIAVPSVPGPLQVPFRIKKC